MLEDKRYVNKDVESIRNELYDIIKEKTAAWTDFNADTFESHVIDLVAGVADMVAYYIDRSILETSIRSARQEKNIRGILTTMNYPLETIGSALGTVTFERVLTSWDHISNDRIIIPKWTNIRTEDRDGDSINYVTTEAALLDTGVTSIDVPIVQGDMHYKSVKSVDLKKSYKYYIGSGDIPVEWVFIDDENWVKVEDAFIELEGGQKYSVHKDNKNRVYILFTYDWKQFLPTGTDETVSIRWLMSLGTEGLVKAYELVTTPDRFLDSVDQNSNRLEIYNKEATYGAFDHVDLNLHKANALRNFRTMERIILLDDFEAKIREKAWVLDCYVCDWRKDYTIVPEPHKLKAWVVTTDLVNTNQEELLQLRNELMKYTVEMTDLEIKSAEYVEITIEMNICVKGNNDYRERIREQVEQNVIEAFSTNHLKFGQVITTDDVEDVATRTASTVYYPEVVSFRKPYILEPMQYPLVNRVIVNLVGDNYGQKTNN
jgi:hypothetical protein